MEGLLRKKFPKDFKAQEEAEVPDFWQEGVEEVEEENLPVFVSEESSAPSEPFNWEAFFGKKFFAWLGGSSLVLAIGFFATWAFSHGLIGPTGRIALGILFSIIVLGVGEYLRPKYPEFFDKVTAAGIGGLLVTIYLARNYDFADLETPILTANATFGALVATVATGIGLALRYNSRFLAGFSIVAGVVIPLFVNSDPNATGLLSYLAILAIAGFAVAVVKKWPEIQGVLFLGIGGYLVAVYGIETTSTCIDVDCNEKTKLWSTISPTLFMGFLYGLVLLLGSGGIVRKVREGLLDKVKDVEEAEIFEFLIFALSLLVANLIGFQVFENQGWPHFGFFVLAQGFGLYGLSEYFKNKGLEIFAQLALGATMVSIIFATIWEVGADQPFVLALMLLAEGLLFSFAGDKLSSWIFHLFGRIALVLSFLFIFEIDNFVEATLVVALYVIGVLYAAREVKTDIDKGWVALSVVLSTIQIFTWSFLRLDEYVEMDALLFLLPVLWSVGVAYSVLKTKHIISSFLGLGLIILLSFTGMGYAADGISKLLPAGCLFFLLLAGCFAVLSSFFIQAKDLEVVSEQQKWGAIATLGITTLLVLFFGAEYLEEPIRTVFWIVWGGLLLGFGSVNPWPHFRYFGIGILCAIIAKLYIVDVWNWEVMVRFVAFFALGLALLSISFLYAKNDKK